MRTYSQDLRERVIRACDRGAHSRTQMATLFAVSTAWIRRLLQRRRQTGSFAARPWAGGPHPKLDHSQRQRLLQLVRDHPDATLAELGERLAVGVSVSTIHRALVALRVTLKKKRCVRLSRSGQTSSSNGRSGRKRCPMSTRGDWSSWTRAGRT
jgi:transposase